MLVTNTGEWIVQTRQSKQRRGIVVVFPTPEELARNKGSHKKLQQVPSKPPTTAKSQKLSNLVK